MKMIKMTAGGARPLLALALLAAGVGAAHAGPVSEVVTASDKAVFAKAGSVTLTITPRTDLMAGTIAGTTVLGTLKVVPSSENDLVVWRWTPGSGTPMPDNETNPRLWLLAGKNDPTHKLEVLMIEGSGDFKPGTRWSSFNTDQKGTIDTVVETSGHTQQIAPDTYTLSLDAAVWAS